MTTINRYVLVDADDHEQWEEYDTYQEAKDAADARATPEQPWAVVEREYEYSDSGLVYTTDQGAGDYISWPPSKR